MASARPTMATTSRMPPRFRISHPSSDLSNSFAVTIVSGGKRPLDGGVRALHASPPSKGSVPLRATVGRSGSTAGWTSVRSTVLARSFVQTDILSNFVQQCYRPVPYFRPNVTLVPICDKQQVIRKMIEGIHHGLGREHSHVAIGLDPLPIEPI